MYIIGNICKLQVKNRESSITFLRDLIRDPRPLEGRIVSRTRISSVDPLRRVFFDFIASLEANRGNRCFVDY